MSRIETIAEGVTLHLGDCRDVLPALHAVDAVITSPPYAQQRDYGAPIENWNDLVGTIGGVPSHNDTQILVNLGLIYRDGEVWEYWDPFKEGMRRDGWRFFGWYVWDKQDAMAGDWNGRLAPAHEWVFHFNRNAVKPNKVVQCKGAGQLGFKGNTGLRRPDGSMSGWSHMGKATQEFKIADSVLRIQPQRDRTDPLIRQHPAVYPVDLPKMLIDSFTAPDDLVLDPFLGSGTTGVAAVSLGRRFIGIELDQGYFDNACKRIAEALRQPDLFIEKPAPAVQLGLLDASE
jgi:DNA modification methylase